MAWIGDAHRSGRKPASKWGILLADFRRLDGFGPQEGPQRRPQPQQIASEGTRPPVFAGRRAPKQPSQAHAHRHARAAQPLARDLAALVLVPEVEESLSTMVSVWQRRSLPCKQVQRKRRPRQWSGRPPRL
jgi:hypothetical protein